SPRGRTSAGRGGARGGAAPAAAHSDDVVRVHPGLRAAVDGNRIGVGGAADSRHGRHQRNAGGHAGRRVSHSSVVRGLRTNRYPARCQGGPRARTHANAGGGCVMSRERDRSGRRPTGNRSVVALVALLASAWTVGPNYKRPPVTMPDVFRSQTPNAPVGRQMSFADERWSAVFDDEALQRLIATALTENFDLQIAASRILQADAQLGITRADRLPTVSAQASAD